MPIYKISEHSLIRVEETTYSAHGISERDGLQRFLRDQIEIISPETLVIAEEFSDWEDSGRRVDLLGIDRQSNLVVIELKSIQSGGHMELQALRYAAMVSTMTFEKAVETLAGHLKRMGDHRAASELLLEFLGWDEPDEDSFAQDVRIVLASADFSKELMTAVLWLNERDLDIRCVRLKPCVVDGNLLIDVQQIVPLPEAADFQVRVREKEVKERQQRRTANSRKWTIEAIDQELGKGTDGRAADVAIQLQKWVTDRVDGLNVTGGKSGIWHPYVDTAGVMCPLWYVSSEGTLGVRFRDLKKLSPFQATETRLELLNQIRAFKTPTFKDETIDGIARFELSRLSDPARMAAFQQFTDQLIHRLRDTSNPDLAGTSE